MSSRNIAIWESPYDLQKLSSDGLNLCIAKSVIDSSGHPSFNMVWKSLNLAPRANISWNTQYGLNWALNVPTANAQVTLGGVWQACNPGEVYDIDNVGLFQPSTVTPQPGYLKVGKNGYSYGGSSGIHIIVGVQSSPGAFDPVYIDPTALAPGMSAWYQPQEKAEWWYENGVQSASMISGAASQICTYDLTQKNPNTNTYFVSSTFQYDTGSWSTSLAPSPSANRTGLMRSFGTVTNNLNDSTLDNIRGHVVSIMEALEKIGLQSQARAPGPGPEFYIGLVKFATTAYCAHGVKAIVQELIGRDYHAEVTLDGTKTVASIKITPPSKSQSMGSTGGIVPQQVTNDWNAAVKTDAVDKPTNEGISSSSSSKGLTQASDNDTNGGAENGVDGDFNAN